MSEQERLTTPDGATHSIQSREPVRQSLAADVEAFLKRGGNIEQVPVDFRADPPKRPENTYGRGSL
ncbi:MAG: hypothetical protein R3E86_12205 [Pseudomonadales bacterium]